MKHSHTRRMRLIIIILKNLCLETLINTNPFTSAEELLLSRKDVKCWSFWGKPESFLEESLGSCFLDMTDCCITTGGLGIKALRPGGPPAGNEDRRPASWGTLFGATSIRPLRMGAPIEILCPPTRKLGSSFLPFDFLKSEEKIWY